MNPMKLNITKPAIQVAVSDIDGNVFFHTMTLEKAELLAKEIANTIHEMRTGKRADEVGFVFWNTTGSLPEKEGAFLVSYKLDGRYQKIVTTDEFGFDFPTREGGYVNDFEETHPNELCGWAEFPAPVTNEKPFEKQWEEDEE